MNNIQIGKIFTQLLMTGGILAGMSEAALAECRLNARNGPNQFHLPIPAFVHVPVGKAFGDIVWQSGPQTVRVHCWVNSPSFPDTKFDVSIRMGPTPGAGHGFFAGKRLSHSVVFEGREMPSANDSWQNPTGRQVSHNDGGITFDATYNVILRRGTDSLFSGPFVAADATYATPVPGVTFFVGSDLNIAPGLATHLTQWFNTTFLFEGQGTCAIETGDQYLTVQLPTVSSAQLSHVGANAGRVPFSLRFSSCNSAASTVVVRFAPWGLASAPVNYLDNTGSALGVAVRIGRVATGAIVSTGERVSTPIVNERARLDMFAEYVRIGELTGGTVRSRAEVFVQYL